MSFSYSLCFFTFVQFLSIINGQFLDETCTIAHSIQGKCVSVYSCPPIVAALQGGQLKQAVIDELRRLQCGYAGTVPLVCCSDGLSFNPTTSTTPQPVTSPSTTRRPTQATNPAGGDEDLLPTPSNCGDSETFRIFGGNVTDITEFPWMVILGYTNKTGSMSFECGGVLINDRYVLTAAHCVNATLKLELARLGEYNLLTSPDCIGEGTFRSCAPMHQDISIEEATVHPGYSPSNVNRKDDIALLRLSEPAEFSVFVNPICLPTTPETRTLTVDDDLYVAGWGKILNGTKSNLKLKLTVPLFNKERCDSLFRIASAILTDRQVCAGGEFAKDTCSGDSGGPLMKQSEEGKWITMGVISFGSGCGKDGWPGVYTDVRSYMDWIRQTVRK